MVITCSPSYEGHIFCVLLPGIDSCLQESRADSGIWKFLAELEPLLVFLNPQERISEWTLCGNQRRKKNWKNNADSSVTVQARSFITAKVFHLRM